ncbi:MAG TPA: antA/AntB antirepressor family protein, partial [Erysipelotrichaceae bacterium]|nr:antA/AntB antirepressor family protein [Erysipelotrichaceae bacterium]
MNKLIKISTSSNGITLSGRDLHEFLEVDSNYTTWFKRMTEYGFSENEDFIPNLEESTGGRPSVDHILKLDMAKEIAMIQRSEKGKQARKYFLDVEKKWNSPEMIMKRALEFASKQVENLMLENKQKEQIIGELKPKATYYDLILQNSTLLAITVIAKDYGMSGTALNDT